MQIAWLSDLYDYSSALLDRLDFFSDKAAFMVNEEGPFDSPE